MNMPKPKAHTPAAQASEPKTSFGRSEYREAKAFLADATRVSGMDTPNVSNLNYQKPDGSIWHEQESHLEAPYDDYTLTLSVPADTVKRVEAQRGLAASEAAEAPATASEASEAVDLAAVEPLQSYKGIRPVLEKVFADLAEDLEDNLHHDDVRAKHAEIPYESRSGFIPSTDGGWNVSANTNLGNIESRGGSQMTNNEAWAMIEKRFKTAKEWAFDALKESEHMGQVLAYVTQRPKARTIGEIPEGYISRADSPADEYFPEGITKDTHVSVVIRCDGKNSLQESVAGNFGWAKDPARPSVPGLEPSGAPITHYRILDYTPKPADWDPKDLDEVVEAIIERRSSGDLAWDTGERLMELIYDEYENPNYNDSDAELDFEVEAHVYSPEAIHNSFKDGRWEVFLFARVSAGETFWARAQPERDHVAGPQVSVAVDPTDTPDTLQAKLTLAAEPLTRWLKGESVPQEAQA